MTKRKRIPVRVIRDPDVMPAKQAACKVRCVGDRQCVCSEAPHIYHICKNVGCECRDALREGVAA